MASRKRRPTLRPSVQVVRLEDRTVPSITFPDYTLGRYPFGGLAGLDPGLNDLPHSFYVQDSTGFLTGPRAGDPLTLASADVPAFAGRAGLQPGDVTAGLVTSSYSDGLGGMSHIYLQQMFNGLPVLNSSVGLHYTADGRLINLGGQAVPGLAAVTPPAIAPVLSPSHAVAELAFQTGYDLNVLPKQTDPQTGLARATTLTQRELSDLPIPAGLVYVNTAADGVRLAWHLTVRTPDGQHWYDAAVDAQTGKVRFVSDWVDHYGETYRVLALPAESPIDPLINPANNPALDTRSVMLNPENPAFSPFGWHDTNGVAGPEYTDTRGNNVNARLDTGNVDPTYATTGGRPDGGAFGLFDNPIDFTQGATTYQDALVANLFYVNNMLHDVHAAYGFTEAAGNFQQLNYTGQGLGNDGVNADAQDGSGTNNANFGTPPDGTPGRMQMYLFNITDPTRDSDIDNGVILHEYGHGVSNRLTGGPANSNALNAQQSGGMGEGWSDFYSLMFTQLPTDAKNQAYPMGTYVLGQNPVTGGGIRRFPYSFNMAINPQTFANYASSTEVHDAGELWCDALWDMNWLLIGKYGFDPDLFTGYDPIPGTPGNAGNKLTLRLVMDGMKLQPANPSFTQARDAILQADLNLTGGANRREIWTAFARRALGASASTASSSSSTITTATDLPAAASNPGITAQSLAGKQIGGAAPGSITLTFSEAMNPGSFDPTADVTSFTGPGGVDLKPAITGFTWGAGNTTLTITFTPLSGAAAQGIYRLTVGPQLLAADNGSPLDQNIDGTAGGAADGYTAAFSYDAAQLTVAGVNPPNGGVIQPSVTTIDVTYSEPVSAASVGTDDIVLSHATVTGATPLSPTTVRYTVNWATPNEVPTVYLQVRYGKVLDQYGFPVAPFTESFTIDIISAPFPALTPYAPRGTLSYSGAMSAFIQPAVDADEFTFTPEAGAVFSVIVEQTTTLRPTITVIGPSGATVGTNTAAAAGGAARLLNIAVPTTGTYKLQITGAGGTTGGYRTFVELGTVPESEANGGATNNTAATAQPLAGAFVTVAPGVSVAAVAGRSDTSPDLLPNEAEPNNTTATANTAARNFVPTPASQFYQLAAEGSIGPAGDTDWYNIGTLQAGDVVSISLSGGGDGAHTLNDPYLELWRTGSGAAVAADDDSGPYAGNWYDSLIYRFAVTATDTYYVRARVGSSGITGTYRIGVYLENTGPAPATTGSGLPTDTEPNDSLAAAQNVSTTWRQVGYEAQTTGTLTAGDVDYFAYQFTAGDRVTVRAVGVGNQPQLGLFDATGKTILLEQDSLGTNNVSPLFAGSIPTTGVYFVRVSPWNGTGNYTLDVQLSTAAPPATPAPGVDYYSVPVTAGQPVSVGLTRTGTGSTVLELLDGGGAVVATGAAGAGNYSLLIPTYTPSASGTFTVRVSDLLATDYTLSVSRGGVLEREPNDTLATATAVSRASTVLGGTDAGNDDWYAINLSAGSLFTANTTTPGDSPGEPVNGFDPVVELYTAAGVKVAFDDNSGPDGRNAALSYTVPAGKAGGYRVRVTGAGGTFGDYTLAMFGNAAPAGVTAGGPYVTGEGGSITLAGAATDADADPLAFTWDLNGDGVFGDATGATATVSWVTLQALGLGDGAVLKTVTMKVSDGFVTVTAPATTLTVNNTPPTATFALGTPVPEGSPSSVTFSAVAEPSPADQAAGFRFAYDLGNTGTWTVGGDTWAASNSAGSLAIPAGSLPDGPGTFPVRARVYDKDDGFTEYTGTITVTNVAPTATLTNGGPVPEGSTGLVRFNAPADPSGGDTAAGFRYAYDFNDDGVWDLGDPASYTAASTDPAPVIPAGFFADGPATTKVRARILDRNNGFTEYTTTIAVLNVAPTATVTNSGPVPENSPATVTVGGPFDPSAADQAGLKYAYDFGDDGVWDAGSPTYAKGVAATAAVVPAARLANGPAAFPVRVRVMDKDGGATEYVTTIVVNEVAPTATVANSGPVDEGGAATVSFSNAFDPSPTDQVALRFAYDFNADGVWEYGPDYASATTQQTAGVPAALLADGPTGVSVRMRVIDPKGGYTEYLTTVQVNNVAPTATVSNSGPVPEGGTAGVSVAGQLDPSAADLATLHYAYDFDNDGTFDLGDGTYAGSGASAAAAVPPALLTNGPAVRTVRVRVIDKDGGATTYTTAVNVLNVAPTAALDNSGPVVEGSPASVTLRNPFDPAPADQAALRFAFDFNNDGTWDVGGPGYAAGVTTPTVGVPAALLADGPKTVTVRGRVIDPDGGFTDYLTDLVVTNAPPAGTLLTPGPADEGSPGLVRFDGVTDPSPTDAAAGLRFAFDFDNDGTFDSGDGTYTGSLTDPSLSIPASVLGDGPGSLTVRGRVIDRDGGFADYLTVVTVRNVPPTATFAGGGPVNEGEAGQVGFATVADPSASDTAAGFRYAYDFDDDGTFDLGDGTYAGSATVATAAVPAQFLDSGPANRPVRGRVIDRNGGFTDYVATVSVVNAAPTAAVTTTGPVTVGTPATIQFGSQFDPSAGDATAGFRYSFDFGNDGDFTGPGDVLNGTSPAAAFTFPNPGKYPVRARITDRDGGFTEYAVTVQVDNVRPTAARFAATGPVSEGGAMSVAFTNPFHPGPAAQAAGLRFAYDFDGDGTFDLGDGTYAGSVKAATAAMPADLLADSGPRTVKGRVIEVNGAFTDYTATFTVDNAPPTATVVGPAGPVSLGQPATITLTNPTDPSSKDAVAGFTYGFDFNGDGVFEVVGPSPTAQHTFPAAGTYPVTVRVTDVNGGSTDYTVPVTVQAPPPVVVPPPPLWTAVGADVGSPPVARLFDQTGKERFNGLVFDPGFTGGVRVAVGDVNGDGTPDLIAGTGPGGPTQVRVIDGATGQELWNTQPFEASFTGGVYVAAGDINADGFAEVAIAPDQGGGPRVRVFTGKGYTQVADFLAIDDPNFRGGARPAFADVNGDQKADLLVSAGFGGGPRVAGFDGAKLGPTGGPKLFADFFAFESTLTNGVYLAAGDVNGDGFADLLLGGGPGGGPRVLALDGKGLLGGAKKELADFFAGDPAQRGGVRVSVADLDGDKLADILTGDATGNAVRVHGYRGTDLSAGTPPERYILDPFPGFVGGVFVG